VKILLTGASGRLGRFIVSAINKDSHELVVVTRKPMASEENARPYIVDFGDTTALRSVFQKERPDVVIHLAAITGSVCEQDNDLAYSINVDLTKRLAELARDYEVSRFIFASTAAVYNQQNLSPTDEYTNIDPLSVYGKTKLAAEKELELVAQDASNKTSFTSLRIFNVYGPGFDQSLINRLLNSTEKHPVELIGLENFYRDYIYVKEVARAMLQRATQKVTALYSVYNIASGVATSNKELLDTLRTIKKTPYCTVVSERESYSWANIERAREEFGFSPSTKLTLVDD
tara:strand:+ start:122 stop:985 length:864 start_codon:yes stop_codon:yes gene_type:complete